MQYRRVDADNDTLGLYEILLKECFGNNEKFNAVYLRWLYRENPDGEVFGYDAFDGEILVAHYACIPIDVCLKGIKSKLLLSLNTATHPDYRGLGLFTALAEKTYEMAKNSGFDAVYGIANSSSTPGFINKLGFQLVAPLDVKVGLGFYNVGSENKGSKIDFVRMWNKSSLNWRLANPISETTEISAHHIKCRAYFGVSVLAPLPNTLMIEKQWSISLINLYVGLDIAPIQKSNNNYLSVPNFLKPSPLNFIFKSLTDVEEKLDPKLCKLTFLDFDAY